MTFEEFAEKKDKKAADQVLKCKNIDEFRKFATENKIDFTEDELKQIWNCVQIQIRGESGELDDDALESVAGGANHPFIQYLIESFDPKNPNGWKQQPDGTWALEIPLTPT